MAMRWPGSIVRLNPSNQRRPMALKPERDVAHLDPATQPEPSADSDDTRCGGRPRFAPGARRAGQVLQPRQLRIERAQQLGELHEASDRLEEVPGQHVERNHAAEAHPFGHRLPSAEPERHRSAERDEQDRDGVGDVAELLEPLAGVELTRP